MNKLIRKAMLILVVSAQLVVVPIVLNSCSNKPKQRTSVDKRIKKLDKKKKKRPNDCPKLDC